MEPNEIRAVIPGEPMAQRRARTAIINGHAVVYDPRANRVWKATARQFLGQALAGRPPLQGPLALQVFAWFTMPTSRHLKKSPRPAERRVQKPDLDNVIKAVKDAATGVLWLDDRQVVALTAEKWTAAQGEAPCIVVIVRQLEQEGAA